MRFATERCTVSFGEDSICHIPCKHLYFNHDSRGKSRKKMQTVNIREKKYLLKKEKNKREKDKRKKWIKMNTQKKKK